MNLRPVSKSPCKQPVSVVECGSCNHMHLASFSGDCRDNANRLSPEQLDSHYGGNGWIVVERDD